MTGRCLVTGFRTAFRRLDLAALLWAWSFLLALVAIMPLWAWTRETLALAPETDILRDRLSLGVLAELIAANAELVRGVVAAVVGLTLVAGLSNAFVAGGLIAACAGIDADRGRIAQFFAGGGRFFGRFVRLLLMAVFTHALLGGLIAGLMGALIGPLTEGGWEPGSLVSVVAILVSLSLVTAVCLLALDYARIRVAVRNERRMIGAWLRGLGFVLRHPIATFGIGLVAAAGWSILIALAYLLPSALGAASAGLVAAGFLAQQATVFLRASVRVAQVGAETELVMRLVPPVPAAVVESVVAIVQDEPAMPPEEPGEAETAAAASAEADCTDSSSPALRR